MKLMSTLGPLVAATSILLPFGKCWTIRSSASLSSLSFSCFTARYKLVVFPKQQHHSIRSMSSHARPFQHSSITMMPEGPEVRTVVDQLQGGVGRRLVDIQFLSGRYVKHGRPNGFEQFAKTMTPCRSTEDGDEDDVDIIKEWNAKGKFIYIVLDQEFDDKQDDTIDEGDDSIFEADDYLRSIWITLGMTGQFVNPTIHEEDPKFARWYIEMLDPQTGDLRKVYYHDQRNFGTLKFSLSKNELLEKLATLGPDILDSSTTAEDFLGVVSKQRPSRNICVFLMDQSKIAGVGNYILSECLYRANIDPFASIEELNEGMLRNLFDEIQAVATESYSAQGLTRRDGGTFRTVAGTKGNFEFQLQCYGRESCAKGYPVIKETQGPHKRTIWYTTKQLFKPLKERYGDNDSVDTTSSNRMDPDIEMIEAEASSRPASAEDTPGRLSDGLVEEGWRNILSDTIESEQFNALEQFLENEGSSGATIYPPQPDIFAALNLCPFDKVKVVICGQDPYHGPGQGHGLAFSVRLGVPPPPSLKNIFREVIDDVEIPPPAHGNLYNWAKKGVLLLNTVMTVRRGEANSHKQQGWEEFTDSVIRAIDEQNDGVVFLLWGNPAQQKAKGIDESKHVVIRTSHPSPLGATKTKSPFLGSRCFSRANQALEEMGKDPVDWTV